MTKIMNILLAYPPLKALRDGYTARCVGIHPKEGRIQVLAGQLHLAKQQGIFIKDHASWLSQFEKTTSIAPERRWSILISVLRFLNIQVYIAVPYSRLSNQDISHSGNVCGVILTIDISIVSKPLVKQSVHSNYFIQ